MATVVKDFKVKNGLIVEGTTGTINNHDILTKKEDDQNYIIGLIGGSADSANTPNTVVKRDNSGAFAAGMITANLTGDVTGNADTATALETSRTIELTGDVTGQVSFNGTQDVQISTTLNGSFATDAEVATAKSEAISDAAADATTKANTALQDAKDYTDEEILDALATAATDATNKADAAEAAANSYTNDAVSQEVLDRNSAISSAISTEVTDRNNAISSAISTEVTNRNSAIATAKQEANDYTDEKISDLVDGAPGLLDTLNELAAAIADDENFAVSVTNNLALKADITYVNSEISDLDSAAQGYASTAESNANSYTNSAISTEVSDRNSAISSAISTEVTNRNNAINAAISEEVNDRNDAIASAIADLDASSATDLANAISQEVSDRNSAISSAIDALDTDDIEEGSTNLYFTSNRAKIAAAQLITSATKTNIQITGDENGLTILAENGVADSTTNDLVEGTGPGANLYFTDARAVSALEAVVPNFTAVEVNSLAKQVAATTSVTNASTITAFSWAAVDYRTAKFLVKTAYGTHTDVSEVLLTLDTSNNVAITEYAMVGTNGSAMIVSADVDGSNVRLRVQTVNNNSTVTVVGTLLA